MVRAGNASVIVRRCGSVEMVHEVSWVVSDATSDLDLRGERDRTTALRSCGKPFQIAALLDGGLAEVVHDSDALALMGSSHNGEDWHVEKVLSLLSDNGLSETDLLCGTHEPYRSWVARRPASNNCSGKHAAMLILSGHRGWGTNNYVDPSHPVQQLIKRSLQSQFPATLIPGIDGCGAPTYAVQLNELARSYAQLANKASMGLGLMHDAYRTSPSFLGGTDRIETHLNKSYDVLAKPGSDGLWAAALPGKGLGLAVKVDSGNENAASLVALTLLEHMNILSIDSDPEIKRLLEWDLTTCNGKPAGTIDVTWTDDLLHTV
ncbi:asparaginase [Subtercola lobariae]|uniref:asparaginase n=1 Tax=Subtercola lobariae TaxID=1588641 RepID=UPI00227A133A|nr:asparaginase [Subtercola lobariae]